MKSTWFKKTAQTSILIAQAFLAVACASAKEEAFDYSSYEQQAGYSVEYFESLAKSCSESPNVTDGNGLWSFRACKTGSNQVSTGVRIFSEKSRVLKMCVFPTFESGGEAKPIVSNPSAPAESRFLKICGTITDTGSSATINHADVKGLLMVDAIHVDRFSQCLAQADFRSCANAESIGFAEGSL